MKAATGELSLTLITVVAIGAVLAFFWLMWGNIKNKIGEDPTGNWQTKDPTAYVETVKTTLA